MSRSAATPAPPESKLVPFRGGPIEAPRQRDPRIDAFRGVALAMIIITHMPGNPYEDLTIRNFGFSDAAEAFFIMSGIAAGIAYSPAVERWLTGSGRLWDAVGPMWNRAWTLYLVQIALTVGALGLYAWAAETFFRAEFRVVHNLGLIYTETGAALAGLATLSYQIGYVNILPAYMVLLLVAPLIVAGGLRAPWWTIGAGLAVWLVSGMLRLNIPNHPGGGGWFFSPFAWQAIFLIGLVIGIRHRKGARLVPVSWPLFGVAATFLVVVLIWRHVPAVGNAMNHKMAQLGALGVPWNVVSHNKTFLAMPRFLHILALVYVISCLPSVTRLCGSAAMWPLRLLGRHGLLVFALGTMLALVGQILMDVEPAERWLAWTLPPAAIAICAAAAWLRDRAAGRPRRARPDRVAGQAGSPPRPALDAG